MAAVDFLHRENPSTWAGVEPATLGADGQRQTNYVTQSAIVELTIATPPGFHRSTNRHHATQQNGKHHFCQAQHHRLSRYGIEDCSYSPDAQRITPIQHSQTLRK
ncbi:hypothetical protein TNCV_5059721 [Trichonephila clavipes]|nr:hypothetical protein TNCV_5059721 [Trichonephila clavipes]